jgi:hypothetical protein
MIWSQQGARDGMSDGNGGKGAILSRNIDRVVSRRVVSCRVVSVFFASARRRSVLLLCRNWLSTLHIFGNFATVVDCAWLADLLLWSCYSL